MKIKIYLTLIALVFIASFEKLNAQCNPDIQIQPGQYCGQSAITSTICEFNGLCRQLQPGNWGNDFQVCWNFSLQNPDYYSFVAAGNIFDLNITVSNCQGAEPVMQWFLFEDCSTTGNGILCDGLGVGSGDEINIHYEDAIPGHVYYLIFDGKSGSTCHYEFHNSTGGGSSPVGEIVNDSLTGKKFICPFHILQYSFEGFENANIYEWSLDGVIQETTFNPYVNLDIPDLEEGIYQLCVKATNGCDTVGKKICWDLILDTARTEDATAYVCAGDSALYQWSYYQIGNHLIDYIGFDNCISKINLDVLEYDLPEDTTIILYVCPGIPDYEWNGNIYEVGTVYSNIEIENPAGCRYEGNLLIEQIDTTGYGILASNDPIPCFAVEPSYLSFKGELIPGNISSNYEWYNQHNQKVGSGETYGASKPGHYYLILTQEYQNSTELGVTDNQTCVIRMDYTIGNATGHVINPEISITGPTPNTYHYLAHVSNLADYPMGTEIEWIIPNGVSYSTTTNGYINLVFNQSGTYPICLYATDGCTISDTICYDLLITVTSSTNDHPSFKIELISNPVYSSLNFKLNEMLPNKIYIDIYSIYGSKILSDSDEIINSNACFNIGQIISGSYIYQLRSESGILKTGKFVKI